ncbi:hypothetical protein REPUB_Repub06bG0160000 [Reevesia pubescens]
MDSAARRRSSGGLFEGLYRVIMRRNSVYVTFVIAGAFLGERNPLSRRRSQTRNNEGTMSASVKLPHISRLKMKICMLGDAPPCRRGKFPTLVTHPESLESKAMVKFLLKKVLCMGVAVGNCSMEEKQIFQNVQLSVNFLVSLLKKNW